MSKATGGLTKWFGERWVDLRRPKPGGGYEECGRGDTSQGKYPKCVPAKKAAAMSDSDKRSAVQRKARAEAKKPDGQKAPVMVPTKKPGK